MHVSTLRRMQAHGNTRAIIGCTLPTSGAPFHRHKKTPG